MVMRAHQVGLIGDDQKRRLFMSYNKRGWRKQEPLDDVIQHEQPRLLQRAIDTLLDNGVTTASELETLLAIPRHDIAKLAGLEPGYLEDPEPSIRLKTPAGTESGDGTASEEEPPPTFRFPRGSNSEM